MTSRSSTDTSYRIPVAALLLLSMGLYLFPLWWGLPASGRQAKSWAFDEISPNERGYVVQGRHHGRYPPLHYLVLRAYYAPARSLMKAGVIEVEERAERRALLQALGRFLSCLLAVASIYWVYRTGRLLFDRRSALFGAATWAFVTPLAFYAKTVNLDAPYLFWFSLSLLFFARILLKHRLRDYLLFAVFGVLSFTTKDQAAALYILPSLGLVFDLAGHYDSPPSRLARLGRALFDRRLLLGFLVAVVLFAIVHDLPSDWGGFVHHVRVMTGWASEPANAYPPTVAGHVALFGLAIRHVAFSLSWPLFLLAVAGVAIALSERQKNRVLLMLLLFPISYYLVFIVPVHFHRLRYLLPVCLVLSLFAARGSTWIWRFGRGRRWASVGLLVMLGWAFAQSLSLDLRMYRDSRYRVEAWMRSREAAGESVMVLGDVRQRIPRSERPFLRMERVRRQPERILSVADPAYLVVNEGEFRTPGEKVLLEGLLSGELNYEVDHRVGRQPARDLLDMSGLSTNLVDISPELTVLRRVGEWGWSAGQLEVAAVALLNEDSEVGWSSLRAAVLESRRLTPQLDRDRVVGYGLRTNRTTRGTQPAVFVMDAPLRGTGVPRVSLECSEEERNCPTAVDVVTSRSRRRVELVAGQPSYIELEPIPAASQALMIVAANSPEGVEGESVGGVRVQVTVDEE